MTAAAAEALAVDNLARVHERPLARGFTQWFRFTFIPKEAPVPPLPPEMPGFSRGHKALASLAAQLRDGGPLDDDDLGRTRCGCVLCCSDAQVSTGRLLTVSGSFPDPPRDLLLELLWCIVARSAWELGEPHVMRRARVALELARHERAAGIAVIDRGCVEQYLSLLGS